MARETRAQSGAGRPELLEAVERVHVREDDPVEPRLAGAAQVVFLPNYEMGMAKVMVAGAPPGGL